MKILRSGDQPPEQEPDRPPEPAADGPRVPGILQPARPGLHPSLEALLARAASATPAGELFAGVAERVRREQEERRRHEALPPTVVLYTVHGTFARGAAWTKPDSKLCMSLRRDLGWRVKVVPVDWSGRNQVGARMEGAEILSAALRKGLREHPDADHFVIAHSHGGNVALSALADASRAQSVAGVLTLATPFLSARVVEGDELLDPFTALFASLFAGWCVVFAGAYQGHGWSWFPWGLGLAAVVLAVLFLGMWLSSKMQAFARVLAARMPQTALGQDKLAVIRVEGDEAIATLAGARFAGAAVGLLWRILTARVVRAVGKLLAVIDYGGWRKTQRELRAAMTKRAPKPPALGHSLFGQPPVERAYLEPSGTGKQLWETAKPVVLQSLPVLLMEIYNSANHGTQLAILGLMGVYCVPALFALLLVALSVPIGVLTSLSLLPCGWTVPLAGPYLHLTAEPSPRGSWNVTQFDADLGSTALGHSHAYQTPQVWSFAARWIGARRRAPVGEAPGPGSTAPAGS